MKGGLHLTGNACEADLHMYDSFHELNYFSGVRGWGITDTELKNNVSTL